MDSPKASSLELRAPESPREWEQYYAFRWLILRKPWDQPKGSERDALEDVAIHRAAYHPEKGLVGVGRLHKTPEGEGQVRYMAVDESLRGQGIGAQILHQLEIAAAEINIHRIFLNARQEAIPFYQRAGYTITGDGPMLFGTIPHKRLAKDLV